MIDSIEKPIVRNSIIAIEILLFTLWIALDWGFGKYISINLCINLIVGLALSIYQTNKTIKYNIKMNIIDSVDKLLKEDYASKVRFRNYDRW